MGHMISSGFLSQTLRTLDEAEKNPMATKAQVAAAFEKARMAWAEARAKARVEARAGAKAEAEASRTEAEAAWAEARAVWAEERAKAAWAEAITWNWPFGSNKV